MTKPLYTFDVMWYNCTAVIKTDQVEATDEADARRKGFELYDGNPPAPLCAVMKKD